MFRKFNLSSLAFAFATFVFLAAFTASSVSAQSMCLQPSIPKTFTYTSSFGDAGAAKARFKLSGNVITVEYWNISTTLTYLAGIGFNTEAQILSDDIESASATRGWLAGAGPGGGLGAYELIAYGNGNKRIAPNPNDVRTATFTLVNAPAQICLTENIVHLTSLPSGVSEKPIGVPDATPTPTPTPNPTPTPSPNPSPNPSPSPSPSPNPNPNPSPSPSPTSFPNS